MESPKRHAIVFLSLAAFIVVPACSGTTPPEPENLGTSQAAITLNNTGLFSTGVSALGAVLVEGSTDPHYTMTSNDATFPGPNAIAVGTGLAMLPPNWVANSLTSAWIGPQATGAGTKSDTYTYSTTFTIPAGVTPANVSIAGNWACDAACSVSLNGTMITTNAAVPPDTAMVGFTIPVASNFTSGTNTLAFATTANANKNDGLQVGQLVVTCTPATSCPAGANCGTIPDGCGGTAISCGNTGCTLPQTCGGGGTANVCGCTPIACTALQCGMVADGCGSMENCGNCAAGSTCVASVCVPNGSSSSSASSSSSSSSGAGGASSSSSSTTASSSSSSSSSGAGGATSSSSSGTGGAASSSSGAGGASASSTSAASTTSSGSTTTTSTAATSTSSSSGAGGAASSTVASSSGSGPTGTTSSGTTAATGATTSSGTMPASLAAAGGCNCTVAGGEREAPDGSARAFGLLAFAAILGLRRRRSRRVLAVQPPAGTLR